MTVKIRKFCFILITILAVALSVSVTMAARQDLPEGIMSILQSPTWEQYEIGQVNYGPGLQDYQSKACYYYDEEKKAAAFVLMHSEKESVLCVFEKNKSGEWYLKGKSASAVLQNGRIPMITAEVYNEFMVSYLDQDRQTDLSVTYRRRNNEWYVYKIDVRDSQGWYTGIVVYDDRLEIFEEKNNWKKRTVPGITASAFDQFSISTFPMTEEKAREVLSLPPEIPTGTGNDSLPNPHRIKFTANKKYAVYSGPGEQYLRSANGKASMSTNDWVQVFGRENGWIMVQYDITSDHMRIGWIREKALPKKASVDDLFFANHGAVVMSNTVMTDDPLFSQSALCTIPADTPVLYLASMGDWAYIESSADRLVRGFVLLSELRINEDDDPPFAWSDPTGKYLATLLAPQGEIHNEEEAKAYAEELCPLMGVGPLPQGTWEIKVDQHDGSWHCSIFDNDYIELYGASFLSNGVIQQLFYPDPDTRWSSVGVRKNGSELDAGRWEQAKNQATEWIEKVAPGILDLVEPISLRQMIDVGDKQYLFIEAKPLDSSFTFGLGFVVIFYEDGHCEITEYSCYGAG